MNITFSLVERDGCVSALAGDDNRTVGSARLRYEAFPNTLFGIVENVHVMDGYVKWLHPILGKPIDQILVNMLVNADRSKGDSAAGVLDLTRYQPTREAYEKIRAT